MNTYAKLISNYEVLTPDGFKPFMGIGKIEKVPLLRIVLDDDIEIKVSYDHVFISDGIEEIAKNLLIGDVLETENGYKQVIKIEFLDDVESVYSLLEVKSIDNSYYTDGVVSKNCKFLGSNSLLIDSDVLEMITPAEPVATKWNGVFLIYELPNDFTYVIGVDTSKGTGRDSSVIQVLKIVNETQIEQVAIYRNNTITPRDLAQVAISISEYYNNSFIMAENNDIGQSLCDAIWYDHECERLLNLDPKGLGIRSTKSTKLIANMMLKDYMDKGYLKIVDQTTIVELSKYEELSLNVFAASEGHDDCITSLLWALYFVRTDYYDGKTMHSGEIDDKYRIVDEDDEDYDGDSSGPVIIIDE